MLTARALLRSLGAASSRAARRNEASGRLVTDHRPLIALLGRSFAAETGDSDALLHRRVAAFAGAIVASGAVIAWGSDAGARCEAKQLQDAPVAAAVEQEAGKARGGRRHLLKKRSKMKEKLEEVDLMKVHLDEYKKAHAAVDSLKTRFQAYASQSIIVGGKHVPAMTFTDFVHSFILPRFHTRFPVRSAVHFGFISS